MLRAELEVNSPSIAQAHSRWTLLFKPVSVMYQRKIGSFAPAMWDPYRQAKLEG